MGHYWTTKSTTLLKYYYDISVCVFTSQNVCPQWMSSTQVSNSSVVFIVHWVQRWTWQIILLNLSMNNGWQTSLSGSVSLIVFILFIFRDPYSKRASGTLLLSLHCISAVRGSQLIFFQIMCCCGMHPNNKNAKKLIPRDPNTSSPTKEYNIY